MISSPNKPGRSCWIGALVLGSFSLAYSAYAQETPRSLVPSFIEKQTGPVSGTIQKESSSPSSETPRLEPLRKESRNIDTGSVGDSLVVEKLGALDPSSVGILSEAEGGFGPGMWRGTSSRLAVSLLEKIPYVADSPQMVNLYRRLLLTGAVLVSAGPDSDQILDIRFRKLRDAGWIQDTFSLIARLPRSSLQPKHQKILVELDLLAGRDAVACQKAERRPETQGEVVFWSKMTVYCRLLAEDYDRAELGAALLEEQGAKDPLFFALFAKLAGDEAPVSTAASDLQPLHLAMIRQANVAIDPVVLETSSPEILNALVTSPQILGSNSAQTIFKAAEKGPSDLEPLRQRFISAAGNEAPGLYKSYASLLDAVATSTIDSEKARGLYELLQLASENGHFQTISKLSLSELVRLTPADYGRDFNFAAVKALLLHGQKDEASAWERVIRRAASQGTPEERLAARAEVIRLDAYMLLSGANAIARWNSGSFAAWKKGTALDPEQGTKTELLLSMLGAFGYPVLAADWQELLFMELPLSTAQSSHALENNLIASAAEGRRGETVALALQALGNVGPAGVTTTTLVAVTSALKAIGLEDEARNLAIEALVAKGF